MVEKQNPQSIVERFEFRLTVNDNLICQRYFKINFFNEKSLNSIELKDAIDYCVGLIDSNLKSKSRIYTWHTAPFVFSSKDEMNNWVLNHKGNNRIRFGESIYLRNSKDEYYWDGENPVLSKDTLNDGEFTEPIDETPVVFKFSFMDSGREVISKVWDGIYYPKFVRNGVDLTNKKGKFDADEASKLNFENSLLYYMTNGKVDLVSLIIKEICSVCTVNNKNWYTTSDTYKTTEKNTMVDEEGNIAVSYIKTGPDKTYNFSIGKMWDDYVEEMGAYYKNKTSKYFKSL